MTVHRIFTERVREEKEVLVFLEITILRRVK